MYSEVKPRDPANKGWHTRGFLPHFDAGRIQQSITYRLHDSLPRQVIEEFEREAEVEPDVLRQRKLRHLIETYVDAGHGACYLRNPIIAQIVIDSWLHLAGECYDLLAWVVMPNHVHLVIRQYDSHQLENIIARWKSFTATTINKHLQRSGPLWMPDYWDRYVRDQDHFARVVQYIENNPVAAGLVSSPEKWPWSSAAERVI